MPDLDKAQLERKIRLVTLATLGFQNIGHELPYVTIASALQVDPSEVERWVIDGTLPFLPDACLEPRIYRFSSHSSWPHFRTPFPNLADSTRRPRNSEGL